MKKKKKRGKIVTVDGYDAEADLTVPVINLWDDYNKRSKVITKVKHGEQVTMLMRVGKGVFIEASDGERGWVTDHFIKELK